VHFSSRWTAAERGALPMFTFLNGGRCESQPFSGSRMPRGAVRCLSCFSAESVSSS